jgi:hypothetical protein
MENGFTETPLKFNQERSKWAIVSLQVALGTAVLLIIISIFQLFVVYSIENDVELSDMVLQYSDLLDAFFPLFEFIVLLVTAYLFISWCSRAYGNLHRLGVKRLSHTEEHVVWAFIIPIISLFRPNTILKEIDLYTKKCVAANDPKNHSYRSSSIIGWWWVFFIISRFVGNIATRFYPEDYDLDKLRVAYSLGAVTAIFEIIAAILAVKMVKSIAANELTLWNKHHGEKNGVLFS